jgi:glycosyltransferase involved in cell wall biosynthesis
MARELGIDGAVRMLGAVSEEERRALFAGAAVQLMPSRFEGFGMVAAEAMAAGVPLVAAAAGSLPEVVDAPRGGVLVPPGDAAALAAAAARLLDDPAARARALGDRPRIGGALPLARRRGGPPPLPPAHRGGRARSPPRS